MRYRVVFEVEIGPYCGQSESTPHLAACDPTAAEVLAPFVGFVANEVDSSTRTTRGICGVTRRWCAARWRRWR